MHEGSELPWTEQVLTKTVRPEGPPPLLQRLGTQRGQSTVLLPRPEGPPPPPGCSVAPAGLSRVPRPRGRPESAEISGVRCRRGGHTGPLTALRGGGHRGTWRGPQEGPPQKTTSLRQQHQGGESRSKPQTLDGGLEGAGRGESGEDGASIWVWASASAPQNVSLTA